MVSIFRLIADYESQFDQQRRDLFREDLSERLEEERSGITIAQRLLALKGQAVSILLRGGGHVEGSIIDVSTTWVLVDARSEEVLIPFQALVEISFDQAPVVENVGVSAKLGVASILRRLAREHVNVLISHDGGTVRGYLSAVYADHVEICAELERWGDVRDRQDVRVVSVLFWSIQKICVTASRW